MTSTAHARVLETKPAGAAQIACGSGSCAAAAPSVDPAAGRAVTVDGVRIAYDDEGAGSPIVLLHAIGHDARDFVRLRARLASRHRVVAVDWPGQGRSVADRVPASAERYADLLDGLLDAIGVTRAVLVGNSIGGAAAIRLAHRAPDRVRALVLENPGGLAPIDDVVARAALAGMARFFAAGTRRAWWFPAAYGLYYRLCVLKTRAAREDRRRIVAKAYDSAPVLLEAWRGFATPAADLRALAPEIRCPVLFAWAKGDQFVQLKRSLPAIRRFPNARLETFRAGHAAHLETPDAFAASLERFLAELPA